MLQGQESPVFLYSRPNDSLNLNNYLVEVTKANGNVPQLQGNPPPDRLDAMAAEIKELRKAVEELAKVLKDRK